MNNSFHDQISILQRSDTVLFQTINSVLYQLEYKLSFDKIGFFCLLILIVVITLVFVCLYF